MFNGKTHNISMAMFQFAMLVITRPGTDLRSVPGALAARACRLFLRGDHQLLHRSCTAPGDLGMLDDLRKHEKTIGFIKPVPGGRNQN
jgi:hypothetical protein